jgi:drug/metabolite transporter (DMT)-like permease
VLVLSKEDSTHIKFHLSAVVLFAEVLRILGALCLVFVFGQSGLLRERFFTLQLIPYAVPAAVYAVNDEIAFQCMEHMDSGTFQTLSNLKILTTAVLCRVALGHRIRKRQWFALFLLSVGTVAGVLSNSYSSSGASIYKSEMHHHHNHHHHHFKKITSVTGKWGHHRPADVKSSIGDTIVAARQRGQGGGGVAMLKKLGSLGAVAHRPGRGNRTLAGATVRALVGSAPGARSSRGATGGKGAAVGAPLGATSGTGQRRRRRTLLVGGGAAGTAGTAATASTATTATATATAAAAAAATTLQETATGTHSRKRRLNAIVRPSSTHPSSGSGSAADGPRDELAEAIAQHRFFITHEGVFLVVLYSMLSAVAAAYSEWLLRYRTSVKSKATVGKGHHVEEGIELEMAVVGNGGSGGIGGGGSGGGGGGEEEDTMANMAAHGAAGSKASKAGPASPTTASTSPTKSSSVTTLLGILGKVTKGGKGTGKGSGSGSGNGKGGSSSSLQSVPPSSSSPATGGVEDFGEWASQLILRPLCCVARTLSRLVGRPELFSEASLRAMLPKDAEPLAIKMVRVYFWGGIFSFVHCAGELAYQSKMYGKSSYITEGFNGYTWLLIGNQALMGLVLTTIIHQTGAISKLFLLSAAMIFTSLATIFLFKLIPNFVFCLSLAMIVGSVLLYNHDEFGGGSGGSSSSGSGSGSGSGSSSGGGSSMGSMGVDGRALFRAFAVQGYAYIAALLVIFVVLGGLASLLSVQQHMVVVDSHVHRLRDSLRSAGSHLRGGGGGGGGGESSVSVSVGVSAGVRTEASGSGSGSGSDAWWKLAEAMKVAADAASGSEGT